jgi:hypothetical protein
MEDYFFVGRLESLKQCRFKSKPYRRSEGLDCIQHARKNTAWIYCFHVPVSTSVEGDESDHFPD